LKRYLKFIFPISVVVFMLVALQQLLGGNIKYEILDQKSDPSGKRVAILYTSDAGATTTKAIFVSVLPSNEEDFENVKYIIFGLYHEYDLLLHWKDDRTLEIRLPSSIDESDFLSQYIRYQGLRIDYLEYDSRLNDFQISN